MYALTFPVPARWRMLLLHISTCLRTMGYVDSQFMCNFSAISVLSNRNANFNTIRRSWSGQTAQVIFINVACCGTLESFHPLVHLACRNILRIKSLLPEFTHSDNKNCVTAGWSTMLQFKTISDTFTIWSHYNTIICTNSPLFCQQPSARASQNLTALLPQSHDCIYMTKRGECWHLHRSDCRNTLIYAHTTWRTLPTCDVGLGSLTLPTCEAGDLVELILLNFTERNSYPTSSLDLAPHTVREVRKNTHWQTTRTAHKNYPYVFKSTRTYTRQFTPYFIYSFQSINTITKITNSHVSNRKTFIWDDATIHLKCTKTERNQRTIHYTVKH